MVESSLDAVREALLAAVPEARAIYVNAVPAKFERPSLFVMLARDRRDALSRTMRDLTATWQVVCFPANDSAGNADMFALYGAADRIARAFSERMYLRGADGSVFHVLDVSGGVRGSEAYYDIQLNAQSVQGADAPADIARDVQFGVDVAHWRE